MAAEGEALRRRVHVGFAPDARPALRRPGVTPTRIVIAALGVVVLVLLASMVRTGGDLVSPDGDAFVVLSSYVWVPLLIGLGAVVLRRNRAPFPSGGAGAEGSTAVGKQLGRRPSPSLVWLVAIITPLLVALLAQGVMYMATVAVLVLPVIVLLLALEVLRGSRSVVDWDVLRPRARGPCMLATRGVRSGR